MSINKMMPFQMIRFLILCALLASLTALAEDEKPDLDADDIAAVLQQELKLDEQQTQQVRAAMEEFGAQLEKLLEEQEGEDADPEKMIKGIKQAQDAHNSELQKILGKDKFKQYEAMKEQAIKGVLADLVEIQLMDVQHKTSLTNEQVTKLSGVLGDSKYSLVKIAWENAGKKLRPRHKVKLAKQLKGIQRDARAQIEKILTPEQLKAWDKHKEEQQQKKK